MSTSKWNAVRVIRLNSKTRATHTHTQECYQKKREKKEPSQHLTCVKQSFPLGYEWVWTLSVCVCVYNLHINQFNMVIINDGNHHYNHDVCAKEAQHFIWRIFLTSRNRILLHSVPVRCRILFGNSERSFNLFNTKKQIKYDW